jgi:N6-adenosine-specific RNA methylase IME4
MRHDTLPGEAPALNVLTVDEWAARITARWQDSVEAILDVGRMLIQAQAQVGHGHWLRLIEKLPFGERTAQMLQRIADPDQAPHLANPKHVSYLPPSWGTLHELARLIPEQFEAAIAAGVVHPGMERRDLLCWRSAVQNAAIAATDVAVPTGRYHTIVMDPPWPMKKIERAVHPEQVGFDYPTMDEEQLAAFPLSDMAAPDCHLFLWTTVKFLPPALDLAEAWGFRYVCPFVWMKPGGFQPIGLPQYNVEFALYCRRGAPRFIDTKQFFLGFDAPRREHSRKPDQFYDTVRRVCAGPRIDIFSREKRDGFDQFGNQAGKFGGEAA